MYGCAVAHKYETTTSIHYTKLKNALNFHHIFFPIYLLLPCSYTYICSKTEKNNI